MCLWLRFLYFRIHLYNNGPSWTEEDGEEGEKTEEKKLDKDEKKKENTINGREILGL